MTHVRNHSQDNKSKYQPTIPDVRQSLGGKLQLSNNLQMPLVRVCFLPIPGEPSAQILHANKDENEGSAHDQLPPVEVRGPFVTQQVTQLLMDGVMPGEGDCLGLGIGSGGDDILAVAKQELDLQWG